MKFAIFCIALLATCQAASLMERFPQDLNKKGIMSLMVQVEAHMKSGGPYDAIIKILDQFEQGIKDEQTNHTELYEENKKSCAEELTFRDQAIKEADAAIAEATQTLDGCKAQHNRAKQDLKVSESQLATARTSLGTLERERIAEAEIFGKNAVAYKSLLNGIDEALQMIEELKNGNKSFVEVSRHANKMMLMAAQVRSIGQLSGVMAAMAQVQNKDAGQEQMFVKLNSLFVQFKEDTQSKKRAAEEAEAKAIEHYNKTKARLNSTIQKLTEQIDGLNDEIAELNDCISTQQGLLSSGQSKLRRNTNLKNSATQVCAANDKSYEQQTAARKDELELLVAIKQKVHERYAEMGSGGVKDRASLSNEELVNSYENKSAYEKKSFD